MEKSRMNAGEDVTPISDQPDQQEAGALRSRYAIFDEEERALAAIGVGHYAAVIKEEEGDNDVGQASSLTA